MEKIRKFFEKHALLLNAVMLLVAVVSGGGIAMAEATIGSEGGSLVSSKDEHDPVDPGVGNGGNPNDEADGRLAPGDKTAGQTLDGTQMSSTQVREGGLEDDEYDSEITKFQPWRTPLLRIAREVTNRQNVQNWSIKHPRVGGETLDGYSKVAIAPEADGSIKLTAANFKGSLRAFQKDSTILIPSVQGYAYDATPNNLKLDGGLMLYIVSNVNGVVTCRAVNGKPTDEATLDMLDTRECPTIPANTYMCLGATALSESQLLVPPTNYQAREETFFVQKKGFNLIWTEDYEETKKKFPMKVADVKADALYKYNLQCNRTYWAGQMGYFKKRTEDGAEEAVYTTKGILYQVTNLYTYTRGNLGLPDLTALSKLQFTTFSQSDSAYAFCGKDAMEELLNIVIPGTTKIVSFKDMKEFDLNFRQFNTTFGALNFVYDQGLDMLGYKDAIVICDLKGARRYVKKGVKEQTNDMSKGSGEVREAKRYIRVEADGIALRGYNSILVVPSDKQLANSVETQMRSKVISSAVLPESPAEGAIYALTADYTVGDATYQKGHAYQYASSAWAEYTGYTSVIL